MKLLLALAIAAALLLPVKADAATEYALIATNLNPYYTTVIGIFPTSQECNAVRAQEGYQPGVMYSCRMMYYPG